MTWLDELSGCDSLKAFIRHTTICTVVSKPDGTILWANSAFTSWSGYSLTELQKYGWKQITVPGEDRDLDAMKCENWDAFTPIYSVQKQYYRKNQSAAWGTMTAMRFPPYGDIEFCVVTWVPHEDASQEAMSTALNAIDKAEKASTKLTDAFQSFTQLSEEQKFIMTAAQLAQKHPRITWAIITLGFGLFGLNNTLEILKTVRIVPPAVAVEQHADKPINTP